ncbi:MAG: NAD(P)/FAD-dependent oxidoreductase [Lachnospiraceae bacterium]|nr:NAD(P)/FAD-dependent oxidoreductase [Lachnospiraceae bacterium]
MLSRIIVAGGGASGLMAALTAKQQGAEGVLILERGGEIGKKILSTGSGRCNLTNENQSPECYHSSLKDSFRPVLSQFSKEDTVRFFEENGLYLKAKNGYYYPRNAQALSVRDFLRDCCRKAGVRVELNKKITGVTELAGNRRNRDIGETTDVAGNRRSKDIGVTAEIENREKGNGESSETVLSAGSKTGITGFQVSCEDGSVYECDRLILAGGGKAAPQTGSDGSMFAVACKLGHTVTLPVPALTPLCVKKEELKFFKTAAGARADARITLIFENHEKNRDKTAGEDSFSEDESGSHSIFHDVEDKNPLEKISQIRYSDCGEIQFVDYGLSGIPAFNVSGAAARALAAGQSAGRGGRITAGNSEQINFAGKHVRPEAPGKQTLTDSAGKRVRPEAPGKQTLTDSAGKRVRSEIPGKQTLTDSVGNRVWAEVDFLPEISPELLKNQFDSYRERFPEDTFRMWLRGYLPAKLAEAVLSLVKLPPALYLRKCSGEEAERLLKALKGSRFELSGTGSFEKAQTTSGGIDMRQVNLATLESKLMPGLYFSGEILDVDGICGGYNLQWAWSSGFVAGRAAAADAAGK